MDYLKKHGDSVKQAHGGIGASSHMACLLFAAAAGVQPSLVAYRGTGPALNDMVGGQVDYMCDQIVNVVQQVQAGQIKAYVVGTPERNPALPNVAASKEAGLPEFQAQAWNALFAPKDTPKPVLDTLTDALDKALDDEQIARNVMGIDSAVAGYKVRTFALPYGIWPKNRPLAWQGSWKDPKTGKRRNLGTFATKEAAKKHERAVQYFKRH